mgnify:CR=1 FL=1
MPNPAYFERFENLAMTRDEAGVLEVRMHSDGDELVFSGQAHHDFVDAFYEIGRDRANRVVILTGTGRSFCSGAAL